MAKTRKEKEAILARLVDALAKTGSSVFVKFSGITVSDETAMRRSLKEQGVAYFVAKKSLMKKALSGHGMEAPALDGEVAVAYMAADAKDITAPARLIHEFSKKFGEERFALLGGIFEGLVQGKAAITEVATIPPMQTLRGMFANVINSPIQGLVIALDGIAQKK